MPRIRYDQLMQFCWTVLLPILFAFIFLFPCILYSFDALAVSLLLPSIVLKTDTQENDINVSENESKPELFLPLNPAKIYENITNPENLDLIKKELTGLPGVYAFRYNISRKNVHR